MKRYICLLLAAFFLFSLVGCSTSPQNSTPDELIQNYLSAVKDQDYEAIWNMLPSKIRDYAIEQEIVKDKEDGLDYIYYAVNDYYWLVALDLPARHNVSVEILERHTEDKQSIQKYLAAEEIRIVVEDAQYIECTITADAITQDASFFMIKTNGTWYLLSVVGDDEMFVY